jgi:hypothetical protein
MLRDAVVVGLVATFVTWLACLLVPGICGSVGAGLTIGVAGASAFAINLLTAAVKELLTSGDSEEP